MSTEDWTEECTGIKCSYSVPFSDIEPFNQKYEPKISSEDWTEDSSQKIRTQSMANSPSNVLYVRDFSRKSEPIDRNIIGFSNHRKLGSFRIDDNQGFDDSFCDQNVIKDTIDLDLISKMNINLMEGLYQRFDSIIWSNFVIISERLRKVFTNQRLQDLQIVEMEVLLEVDPEVRMSWEPIPRFVAALHIIRRTLHITDVDPE